MFTVKIIFIIVILGSSVLIGKFNENRIINQQTVIRQIITGINKLCIHINSYGSSLKDALIACSKKENDIFLCCVEVMDKYPRLSESHIINNAIKLSKELSELDEADKNIISKVFVSIFCAEGVDEIERAQKEFITDATQRILEINDTTLKKAKLIKKMIFLGGVTLSIILI